MSRQYNMYNVQLSEFWKQRVGKETVHNAPYMFGEEEYPDDLSEAPSRMSGSRLSVASTATQQKASLARTPWFIAAANSSPPFALSPCFALGTGLIATSSTSLAHRLRSSRRSWRKRHRAREPQLRMRSCLLHLLLFIRACLFCRPESGWRWRRCSRACRAGRTGTSEPTRRMSCRTLFSQCYTVAWTCGSTAEHACFLTKVLHGKRRCVLVLPGSHHARSERFADPGGPHC